ncbi:MAG: hypothetical protein AAGJ69_05385 [Cyanobacteria bacterium J06559_1]
MSDSTTFEFETAVAIAEVTETISFLWDGSGCEASVYTRPEARGRVFCTLHYLEEDPEAPPVVTPVLQYIRSIAVDGNVYGTQPLRASQVAEGDGMLVPR